MARKDKAPGKRMESLDVPASTASEVQGGARAYELGSGAATDGKKTSAACFSSSAAATKA